MFNKTNNVRTIVTLKSVRVTTGAMEEQNCIFSVRVCSLSYPTCNWHAPYYHLWSASIYVPYCHLWSASIYVPYCHLWSASIYVPYCHLWSASIYVPYFATLCHKRHSSRRKVSEHKMWVLVFCTTFVWNIFHPKNWASYDAICVLGSTVKCPNVILGRL